MTKWIDIETKKPDQNRPVILTLDPMKGIIDGEVACLVANESGLSAWFVGNDSKSIVLNSRKYWIYLTEKDLSIPSYSHDEQLLPFISLYMAQLACYDEKIRVLSKAMFLSGKGVYPLDYFIAGVLKRCSSLIFGFETLIDSSNFTAASHLVRPHLDSFLRLFATCLVDQPHDFATKIFEGKAVRDLEDKYHKKMTDSYLMKMATKVHPWIEEVYKETSGFIHFSYKHIFDATTISKDEELTLNTAIGKSDNDVLAASKLEGILCMIEISNCIAEAVFTWICTKRIKG